jgi:hypothetical protein
MLVTIVFCVSWVIFFVAMLLIVTQRSSGRPPRSSPRPSRLKIEHGPTMKHVPSERLYISKRTERYQSRDWALRRLSDEST